MLPTLTELIAQTEIVESSIDAAAAGPTPDEVVPVKQAWAVVRQEALEALAGLGGLPL